MTIGQNSIWDEAWEGKGFAETAQCTSLPWKASYKNEVIQKLSLEVLPILELPFVWEMNSKLIKKRERETIREGRGMGLGKSLRFSYNETITMRKCHGSQQRSPLWCHRPGGVHKRSLLMAPSSFTAVSKILGYKIVSLNPSVQQRPSGAVCQRTLTAKTWYLMAHYCMKIKKGAPLSCFQIYLFFAFCQNSEMRNLSFSSDDIWLGVFVLFSFLSSRAFEICVHVLISWKQNPMVYVCVYFFLSGTYIKCVCSHYITYAFGCQTI